MDREIPLLSFLLALSLTISSCKGPRGSAGTAPVASKLAEPKIPEDGVSDWPRLVPGVESRYFSSFDRGGGNADGFAGRHATLYRLGSGEHVIFDALGPGVLNTLWFTGSREGGEGLDLGKIRFYFDDEDTPRITTDVGRLFGGKQEPFLRPLVADNHVSTGGFVSWVPLLYRKRLVVTTARKPFFFIGQYDAYPPGTKLSSRMRRRCRSRFSAASRAPRPGRPIALDYEHAGTGAIEAIYFKPESTPTPRQLQQARIEIRWDGERSPSVDVPLGMFFGSGLGEARIRALAFAMDPGGAYENRLPMPFWRGFHVRVTGMRGLLTIRLGPNRFSAKEAGHLHAVFHDENPTRPGEDFEWLDREGTGKLVGTVLTIRPPTPETKKWWEGDLRSYVDGRRTPGLHGTGHEDDHLGGWSNTFFNRPFTLPMHGEPRTEIIEREGYQHNANITLYRLWPGIHFMGSIRHSVEHGNENAVQAHYAGVAFFYALPGRPRLQQADRLDLGDAASRERHALEIAGEHQQTRVVSAFEGRAYRVWIEDSTLSHQKAASFTLTALPDNRGCLLRRMFDQKVGRQRARVVINGKVLGDWYAAEHNDTLRWAERDIFLPASFTDAPALRIEIRPLRAGWNAAEYRLLCLTR